MSTSSATSMDTWEGEGKRLGYADVVEALSRAMYSQKPRERRAWVNRLIKDWNQPYADPSPVFEIRKKVKYDAVADLEQIKLFWPPAEDTVV